VVVGGLGLAERGEGLAAGVALAQGGVDQGAGELEGAADLREVRRGAVQGGGELGELGVNVADERFGFLVARPPCHERSQPPCDAVFMLCRKNAAGLLRRRIQRSVES
jgi:hypothetical protein